MVRKMRDLVAGSEGEKHRSEKGIKAIHASVELLRTTQYAYLCEEKFIADMLERVNQDIITSILQAYNPREPNVD